MSTFTNHPLDVKHLAYMQKVHEQNLYGTEADDESRYNELYHRWRLWGDSPEEADRRASAKLEGIKKGWL